MVITNPLYTNSLLKAGAGPAALQNSPDVPQQNALMGGQRPPMPQQQPQVQWSKTQNDNAHAHISDTLKEFDSLLKLPDDELTMSKIYGAAADLITKNRISGGKRGADAMTVAKELASPDFPREKDGMPPSPQAIRAFLQRHFDKHVLLQATLTSKFGPPMQQQPAASPQSSPMQPSSNPLMPQ